MTTGRIGLVGFHSRTGEIFREEGLDVASHIFANPEDKAAAYPDRPDRINFHDWKRYRRPTRPAPERAREIRQRLRGLCFDDFIRCTDRWDWSRELVNDWSDYEHLFSIAFDDAWAWLVDRRLEAVVYSNVPHQGIAVVQYHLARALGLETRIFVQSPFAGRSWLVDSWTDLGRFESSVPGEPFEIDAAPPGKPPFYMNAVKGDPARRRRAAAHRIRARLIVGLGLTGIGREARRRSFQRNMTRWQRAVQDAHYLRMAGEAFRDLPGDGPYVYVPLHLQPEMTTDILGGVYADQISALEELRQKIPEEVAICVKENPKQTGRLRGQPFFDRIRRIPNIRLLARTAPSLDLIERSLAVATISGTAGWEALRMKRPAIVFGHAFWSGLPGAFRALDGWSWPEVAAFRFDAERFENAVTALGRHAHPGICDPAYAVLATGFDGDENARTLCRSLIAHGRL